MVNCHDQLPWLIAMVNCHGQLSWSIVMVNCHGQLSWSQNTEHKTGSKLSLDHSLRFTNLYN